jgi:hypothetical protein
VGSFLGLKVSHTDLPVCTISPKSMSKSLTSLLGLGRSAVPFPFGDFHKYIALISKSYNYVNFAFLSNESIEMERILRGIKKIIC